MQTNQNSDREVYQDQRKSSTVTELASKNHRPAEMERRAVEKLVLRKEFSLDWLK